MLVNAKGVKTRGENESFCFKLSISKLQSKSQKFVGNWQIKRTK